MKEFSRSPLTYVREKSDVLEEKKIWGGHSSDTSQGTSTSKLVEKSKCWSSSPTGAAQVTGQVQDERDKVLTNN